MTVDFKKFNPFKWIAIIPQVRHLAAEVEEALRDKRLDSEEITRIGNEFVAIVAAVV